MPPADPSVRLDPILYGPNPSVRGNAWKERGLWDRAEDAYAEASRARPLNRSVREALAKLYLERGRPQQAATRLAEAVQMMPDDPQLRRLVGLALLWSGDWSGWRRSNAVLLDRFGGTSNARTAKEVTETCVLGSEGTPDPDVPVRLAELCLKAAPETDKADYLNTLGSALYRAGRFDDAIRRLEDGIRLRNGESMPTDWAFLAMAHQRLRNHDEARLWLDRPRNRQPSADPSEFWIELEIRLLRSEVEAVVLYDPIFPADPFGR